MNTWIATPQNDTRHDGPHPVGKGENFNGGLKESFCNPLLIRKMNEEMLHYSARSRCGY